MNQCGISTFEPKIIPHDVGPVLTPDRKVWNSIASAIPFSRDTKPANFFVGATDTD